MPRKNKLLQGRNKDEDEAVVNNELRALNMLEEGMSVEDRRHLLKVVRISETTAEEERRGRSTRKKPKVSEEQAASSELPTSHKEEDKSPSASSSKAGSVSSTDSVEMIGTSDQSVPKSSVEVSSSMPNEEINSQESPKNREILTPSLKHDHLKDKKRNINPFFVDKESYRDSFKRKRGKDYLRFPYDLLAKGLDFDTFAAEFKKYSISYAKKLEKARNKRPNSVEWGKPIVGPTFTLPPRTNKDLLDSNSNKEHTNQRYNLRGRQNKIDRDYLEFIDDDHSSELSRNPGRKVNDDMSKTAERFPDSESKNNCKKEQQLHRESPPLVIVEEVNSGKKLYLQDSLNPPITHDLEKTPKKVTLSTSSESNDTSSPAIPTKRLSLRWTNTHINSNDKNKVCGENSSVVIVEDSDNKEFLHCEHLKNSVTRRTVQSATNTPNKPVTPLSNSPVCSPIVSLKRLPLRPDPSSVPVCDSEGKKLVADKTSIYSDSPAVPDQNVTKRRRLDFQCTDDNILEVEEDRLPGATRSPSPCLQDNKSMEEVETQKIPCPICNQLFSSDIIQDTAQPSIKVAVTLHIWQLNGDIKEKGEIQRSIQKACPKARRRSFSATVGKIQESRKEDTQTVKVMSES